MSSVKHGDRQWLWLLLWTILGAGLRLTYLDEQPPWTIGCRYLDRVRSSNTFDYWHRYYAWCEISFWLSPWGDDADWAGISQLLTASTIACQMGS